MRKVIQAFCLFLCTALVTVQTAQAASPTAADIFSTIGGNTTIDRGGSLHSQTRSIYSLGGGMTSFEGKKVSLMAVDPPSFSAGCNGISWHFGGFAFISLDEIRQLVEAVAQASLGIAVDLAMQTLCPQCYAVMAKLRDISNMMRNAAADSCKIAQNFGAMLGKEFGITPSTSRGSDCAKLAAEKGTTSSWMDAAAGQACSLLSKAETSLKTAGQEVTDWLKFGNTGTGTSPSREKIEMTGNVTYNALTALGYSDGFVKDMMLSLLGMTVYHAEPAADCSTAFQSLYGTPISEADVADPSITDAEKAAMKKMIVNTSAQKIENTTNPTAAPTAADKKTTPASASATGTTQGQTVCFAPPLLAGMKTIGLAIMCGFNRNAEAQLFADNYYDGKLDKFQKTSLGAMCLTNDTLDNRNPVIYTCTKSASGECTQPQLTRLNTRMASATRGGYTGVALMVGDALYKGVKSVRDNTALPEDTKAILNGSGYPLYRLINMAAVYPALAGELLEAYSSAIAAQYTMDTLDKLARIGGQPSISMQSITGLRSSDVSSVREQIMALVRLGNDTKTQVLDRLAEKRQMVEVIMQVNKTLQAEVIGQGLSGNSSLAVSLKRQSLNAKPAAPTTP